jgi:UDP-2,4-diacetamido-2,4,6-trideoxy-beta-L-altropyranose hydrolase
VTQVVIRADASQRRGSGHVMRCLSLADALREQGASVLFVTRDLPASLAQMIHAQGHQQVPLPLWRDAAVHDLETLPVEDPWPQPLQLRDSDDVLEALRSRPGVDMLIVDHYALGLVWEQALRPAAAQLMVVDDLVREHDCSILLDQNLHPEHAGRYAGRVPRHCRMLLGPSFALLRAEFARCRQAATVRTGPARRLLVSMGGADAGNATGLALEAIRSLDRETLEVDVVIGPLHPAGAQLAAECAAMPLTELHVGTSDMAELLARADLAIGAGGISTGERCALGVPTIALCLADNQRELLQEAGRQGLVLTPDTHRLGAANIARHLHVLIDSEGLRNAMSRRGMELVDARGAPRVAAAVLRPDLVVRRAVYSDCDTILQWRNHPGIRAMSHDSREISADEHRRWFDRVMQSPSTHLLIGERSGMSVGVVRFDCTDDRAQVSIYVTPHALGRSQGAALLETAESWLQAHVLSVRVLDAEVMASNTASARLFERCAYRQQFTRYQKEIAT